MKISLNDTMIIGTESEVKADGKREFTRWAVTGDKNTFLSFCQYLIDGVSDLSDFVIIHEKTQKVFSFTGVCIDTLMMHKRTFAEKFS